MPDSTSTAANLEELVGVTDAARILGVHRRTAWLYTRLGELPSRKVAGRVLIAIPDALALKKRLEAEGRPRQPRMPRRRRAGAR